MSKVFEIFKIEEHVEYEIFGNGHIAKMKVIQVCQDILNLEYVIDKTIRFVVDTKYENKSNNFFINDLYLRSDFLAYMLLEFNLCSLDEIETLLGENYEKRGGMSSVEYQLGFMTSFGKAFGSIYKPISFKKQSLIVQQSTNMDLPGINGSDEDVDQEALFKSMEIKIKEHAIMAKIINFKFFKGDKDGLIYDVGISIDDDEFHIEYVIEDYVNAVENKDFNDGYFKINKGQFKNENPFQSKF